MKILPKEHAAPFTSCAEPCLEEHHGGGGIVTVPRGCPEAQWLSWGQWHFQITPHSARLLCASAAMFPEMNEAGDRSQLSSDSCSSLPCEAQPSSVLSCWKCWELSWISTHSHIPGELGWFLAGGALQAE